jgi:hypothetical protein
MAPPPGSGPTSAYPISSPNFQTPHRVMSKEPKRPHQAPLPQNLADELDRFRRRLWQIKIAESVFAGFFGLLFSYLLVFGLDRLMPTGPWLRLGILLAGTSLFIGFAPYWLRRWVWSHRYESQLAR